MAAWQWGRQAGKQLACSPLRYSLYSNYHQRHSGDNLTRSSCLTTVLLILKTHTQKDNNKHTPYVPCTLVKTHYGTNKVVCSDTGPRWHKYSQRTSRHTKALKIFLTSAFKWREVERMARQSRSGDNDKQLSINIQEKQGKNNILGTGLIHSANQNRQDFSVALMA